MSGKRVWALLLAWPLLAGVAAAQAQDNAVIAQPGGGNEALIVQVAEDLSLRATIDQAGDENEGTLIQVGGFDNTAAMTQAGTDGAATILQEGGFANAASITQNAPGSGNEMSVRQSEGQGNLVTVVQSGNANLGSILQDRSFNSTAELVQEGDNNGQNVQTVSLPIEAMGLAHAEYLAGVCFGAWSIYQRGFDLTATTSVTGNDNNTFQYQEGEGLSAGIRIQGDQNTAFQAQCGYLPTTSVITIVGNGNYAGQLTWGGMSSTITILGDGNTALVISTVGGH